MPNLATVSKCRKYRLSCTEVTLQFLQRRPTRVPHVQSQIYQRPMETIASQRLTELTNGPLQDTNV